jgi:hypothetical protein
MGNLPFNLKNLCSKKTLESQTIPVVFTELLTRDLVLTLFSKIWVLVRKRTFANWW